MERVVVYVDGFNLYFGLKNVHFEKYLWLDVQTLARRWLGSNECPSKTNLVHTKYFTSRLAPGSTADKQSLYIQALETLPDFTLMFGQYQPDPNECPKCGHKHYSPQEKRTDVNIAVEMLCDAMHDQFDIALLISGDSDLIPPIDAIHTFFPEKRVWVAFPPRRHSNDIKKVADFSMGVFEYHLRKSVFPAVLLRDDGYELHRPAGWS